MFGVVSILGGFTLGLDLISRIAAIILGITMLAIASSYIFRNFLFSLTFLGAAIASLDLIVDDSGVFDIADLFAVLLCLGMGVYFGGKVMNRLPAIRFSHWSDADISNVDSMTGLEFEQFTADLLSRIGYTNVSVTKASGDHGIDVLAQKDGTSYAIQCKKYNNKLDNTPVQEAYAGKDFYHCNVCVVITNSTFTAGARELADALGVLLWDRQILIGMIRKANGRRFVRSKDIDVEYIPLSVEDARSSNDIVIYTAEDMQKFQRTHTLVDIIDTKVVGVTYNNSDGACRQDILALCSAGESVRLEYFEYHGTPAYAVMSQHGQIGNISAELAKVIDTKYDGASVRSSISAITGGVDNLYYGCNLLIEVYLENSAINKKPAAKSSKKSVPNISSAKKQSPVDASFVAQAQWYAARGGADLIDDE